MLADEAEQDSIMKYHKSPDYTNTEFKQDFKNFFSAESTLSNPRESPSPPRENRDALIMSADKGRPPMGQSQSKNGDGSRAGTAKGKINFINKTLNEYMNSEINTYGSTSIGGISANVMGGMIMLHKHSKLLNSQMPLAVMNNKRRL